MSLRLTTIHRHPVKGLTPEKRESVTLFQGRAIANDRRFALALGSTPVDGTVAEWMPKSNYLMLMRNEKLAQLETSFDDETEALTVLRGGRQVARGVLTTPVGRSMIEDFFSAFMGDEARGRPKLVEAAEGHTLSDHANPVISIINRASLEDMVRLTGAEVDPRRMRGNFLVDGLEPWAELDLPGKRLRIGEALLEVTEPIDRCAATNVNPVTAERDQNIPKALQRGLGHINCGVYARVLEGGEAKAGATIDVS